MLTHEIQVYDFNTTDYTHVPLSVKLAYLAKQNIALEHDLSDIYVENTAAATILDSFKKDLGPLEYGRPPLVRIYGLADGGKTHVLYLRNVFPYMYVAAADDFQESHIEYLSTLLSEHVSIKHIELVTNKLDLCGHQTTPRKVLRVTLRQPSTIPKLKNYWFGGNETAPSSTPLALMGMQFPRLVWEADVKFYRRVCIDLGISPLSWLRVKLNGSVQLNGAIHVIVDVADLTPLGTSGVYARICPDFRVASFDIECLGKKGNFPKAETDPVISVAVSLFKGVECCTPMDSIVFMCAAETVSEVAAPEEGEFRVQVCDTEERMLLDWCEYIRDAARPHFIVGYNSDNFDWPYVLERAKQLGCKTQVGTISPWGLDDAVTIKASTFQSSACGKNEDMDVFIAGVVNVDVCRIMRRLEKLRSYKLADVTLKFLGPAMMKRDFPYTEIPICFEGSAESRRKLADYNWWDAHCTALLAGNRKLIANYVAMARVTGVDVTELITGGQQVKVHAQMVALGRELGFIIPTRWRPPRDEAEDDELEVVEDVMQPVLCFDVDGQVSVSATQKHTKLKKKKRARTPNFTGAVVVEPKRGFYTKPITTLDFSSLYPSIMIAHNLSHDTLVLPNSGVCCAHGHPMDSGAEVLKCCVHETPLGARFVNSSVRVGLLVTLLRRLLSERGAAKRAMNEAKAAGDAALEDVYNGKQNALKISANSVYGFTGASTGKLPCLEISAGVTAYGRDMIMMIKQLVEEVYVKANGHPGDADVIYGDSVSSWTPIWLRQADGRISLTTIEYAFLHFGGQHLYNYIKTYADVPAGVETWACGAWTPLKRIMAHDLPFDKQLYRVRTLAGFVDVTSDHSLLTPDGTPITVGELVVGHSRLMVAPLPTSGRSHVELDTMGDHYNLILAELFAKYEKRSPVQITLLPTVLNSYKFLTPAMLSVDDNIVISVDVLPADMRGRYVYDLETESHTFSAGVGRLVVHNTDSIMVKFGVESVTEGLEIGKKAAVLINAAFDARLLTKEQTLKILAETNNAPVTPDTDDCAKLLLSALKANPDAVAKLISSTKRGDITIVLEKVLSPMLLLSKKRYAGGFWLCGTKMEKIHQSGIESVRRDNCLFTTHLVGGCIDVLMQTCSASAALEFAQRQIKALAQGGVPFNELIVSKGYSKPPTDYADGKLDSAGCYTGKQPHLIVAEKRKKRGDQPYKLGDRIDYVFVEKQGQDAMRSKKVLRQCDIVEDPKYAQAKGLRPHVKHYIKKQAEKPLTRIFDTALGEGATRQLLLTQDVLSIPVQKVTADEPFFATFKRRAEADAPPPCLTLTSAVQMDVDRPRSLPVASSSSSDRWRKRKQLGIDSFFRKK